VSRGTPAADPRLTAGASVPWRQIAHGRLDERTGALTGDTYSIAGWLRNEDISDVHGLRKGHVGGLE
jgi:hypothetical protein